MPKEIRGATVVIYLEALALVAAAIILLVKTLTGHPAKSWGPYALMAFALAGAAVLWLGARGIGRLNPAARTPIVLIQLLALPVSFSLGFQAGLIAYGGPILVAALVVLYLLFSPASRVALDRTSN